MASFQRKGLQARILSTEEEEKLKRDQALVSAFKQQKLEKEAQKNWDLFYKRNSTNFFKDRHWTTREFEELRSCREYEGQKLTLLEAGCGVGNCLFPLLEEDLNLFAYACDFSPRAVDYVKQHPLYNAERCKVFQCDLTRDNLLDHVPPESVDAVTLIFVLSAVHPEKMRLVLLNVYKVLKPGRSVLFRDYGLNDHAMLRFKAGSKLGENFYVRQDGTRSYFFTDELQCQAKHLGGRGRQSSEFENRVVYRAASKTASATQRNPITIIPQKKVRWRAGKMALLLRIPPEDLDLNPSSHMVTNK
ncbi:methyltransferase-like protein 6 isoform X1 [Mus caroli]|uniref:tRNA N(3)-cytidine methyltransferase METTL6 n=1 Tax=Mus caroli TaxID=10089 RepID=A0A6P7PYB4_MUSCR|nr:methyltransferase-like protein 6 isoform X1 [Mus caroli]